MTITDSALGITHQPIGVLKSNPHNSRTHLRRQILQIAASIRAFGFTSPVLADKDNIIIAGHA